MNLLNIYLYQKKINLIKNRIFIRTMIKDMFFIQETFIEFYTSCVNRIIFLAEI